MAYCRKPFTISEPTEPPSLIHYDDSHTSDIAIFLSDNAINIYQNNKKIRM